ncbi:PLP-dependent aminotransferase family protein [Acinetobacter proteolyticus]|uniref:GntR family transcriptional regulator n=1 Tax=Acinetobacter proteolyticus TaxID=1776741 RepID=A0A2N0W992_9GAMM|nr:PLP-dependent aminotransferase family protein [Acinetobacter proteolyticus]PKF31023.1 GntR family transcriptional regulator [Acinetobacter proteolyticus]
MQTPIYFDIDRKLKIPLAEQIRIGIEKAIIAGLWNEGDRLPSWIDLATQLGVSRGTVKIAYDRLLDRQFIVASRSAGTRVAYRQMKSDRVQEPPKAGSFIEMYLEMTSGHGIFQLGVPAKDIFPAKVFNRIRSQAIREENSGWLAYPDPRGEFELRREIAAYLAISRGIECSPEQVFITSGFASGLGLSLHALQVKGQKAWVEDPGFPLSKYALQVGGVDIKPIPVDNEGMDIDFAITHAADATLALCTPGQQAPLGATLSLARRLKLLAWAAENNMWLIEDDYLGELQLDGKSAPALFSLDQSNRVIHLGTFSKTINPQLRIGFAVVPTSLIYRYSEVTAALSPAPSPSLQIAILKFMKEGHFLRHLRRTKRLYLLQRDVLKTNLMSLGFDVTTAGLSVLIKLPADISDVAIAREAAALGMAPAPLSIWYHQDQAQHCGLLLGIATAPQAHVEQACAKLFELIQHQMRNN